MKITFVVAAKTQFIGNVWELIRLLCVVFGLYVVKEHNCFWENKRHTASTPPEQVQLFTVIVYVWGYTFVWALLLWDACQYYYIYWQSIAICVRLFSLSSFIVSFVQPLFKSILMNQIVSFARLMDLYHVKSQKLCHFNRLDFTVGGVHSRWMTNWNRFNYRKKREKFDPSWGRKRFGKFERHIWNILPSNKNADHKVSWIKVWLD